MKIFEIQMKVKIIHELDKTGYFLKLKSRILILNFVKLLQFLRSHNSSNLPIFQFSL